MKLLVYFVFLATLSGPRAASPGSPLEAEDMKRWVEFLHNVTREAGSKVPEVIEDPKSFLPPRNESKAKELTAASCTCKQILVSSLNEAQHVQPASMGVFKYYQMYNYKPSYYGPNGQRLYYLTTSGWLIGPSLGSPTGYVHNANQYACPYLIPSGWMYVNSGYWYNDLSLVVRCIK